MPWCVAGLLAFSTDSTLYLARIARDQLLAEYPNLVTEARLLHLPFDYCGCTGRKSCATVLPI